MSLVEMTSNLAIGAGTPLGSPEGRHTAGPELGVTNVIPDIDATGFTINHNSLPTQFTFANLPQIGLMEAFGKEGVDVSVMSNPPLKEGVDVSVMSNPPLKEAVITITPQEFTVRGYTVTGDRANRNIGGTDTEEFSTKRLSKFDIERRHNFRTPSEFRRDADPGLQLSSRQPFVLRGIGSNWGPNDIGSIAIAGLQQAVVGNIGVMDSVSALGAGGVSGLATAVGGGVTSDMFKLADMITEGLFIRGGMVTAASRTAADEARIIKFMLSPRGLVFIGKQYLLQSMNPMQAQLDKSGAPIKSSNTRLYFPGSLLASLPPGSHMVRHWGVDAIAMMKNINLGISKFVDAAGNVSAFMNKNYPDLVASVKGTAINIKNKVVDVTAPVGEKLDSIAASASQTKLGQVLGKVGATVGTIIGNIADSVSARIFPFGPPLRAVDSARDIVNLYNPKAMYAGTSHNVQPDHKLRSYPREKSQIVKGNLWTGIGTKVGLLATTLADGKTKILQPTVVKLLSSDTSIETNAISVEKKGSKIYDGMIYGGMTDAHESGIAEFSAPSGKLIDRYSTLTYGHLNGDHKYLDGYDKILSPGEQNIVGSVGTVQPENAEDVADETMAARAKAAKIHKGVGGWTDRHSEGITIAVDSELGVVKKQSDKFDTDLADKANLHPYGSEEYDEDFIPFKFKDVVNNKYIIFRAILGGISDSISPDWSDERFIGRPDKVFVYRGADRTISFDFNVYPKTKQELPVLWDKLNYLVGLCYPAWNTNRMVAPFIELSLGDMYQSTPGFLASLSIASQESSTWELDKGLRVPKYLTCSCSFRYIGKYRPSMIGKHFDFDWISSDQEFDSFAKDPATTTDLTSPVRRGYEGLFPVSPNPATETSGISDDKKNEQAVKG